MVIDGHAHVSSSSFSSPEALMEQLKAAQVDKAVIVPGGMLDVRKMSSYVTGKSKPESTEPCNDFILETIRKYPDVFYGFYCVNPNQPINRVLEEVEQASRNGFKGLKLSPMVHQISFLGQVSKELAALCGELNLPFYTHVVVFPGANTSALGMLAKEFPKTNFVFGHMGFGPLDNEAIELSATTNNLFLETSTATPLALRMAVEQAGPDKMFYGSEFPLSDPVIEKLKIERLSISSNDKEKILSGTLSSLLGL
ncbi:amidohydrolase family protein [Paenibacillus sp. L3-i20]|uniref:amidohydrolase family protein n=1 Tax=Paenibacillus sp. L3-i20 TaxID=2905833 RepID=UPI001EDE329B|nr:amidohydrolase family protein [Paenibacillus sp. L3-i20]GKU77249.1 amidohydrolase [Paenibacillus sp. L3-i20]